jgi:hypothetical protein
MRPLALLLLAAVSVGLLPAQEDVGTMPTWEVAAIAENLEAQTEQAEQILTGVKPEEWPQAGAAAYAAQRETLLVELAHLRNSARAMASAPERLPLVVDTFLWIDRTNSMMASMTDGVRRYQNAAVADLLESARGQYSGAGEKLKEYMRQLAVSVDAQMQIAHEEAQRCRTELVTRPR